MSSKRSWTIDEDAIREVEIPSQFSGAHEVIIKEAISGYYNGGAEYVKFRVAIPARLDQDGNPKEYSLRAMTIFSGNAKGNAPITRNFGILSSAFKLLGLNDKPNIGLIPAKVWSKEEHAFVEEKVEQFKDMIGKKIGMVISLTQSYPITYIDGYTKEILSREEAQKNPYSVVIPNYTDDAGNMNKTYSNFNLERFFSIDEKTYGKTYTEIMDNKPAKQVTNLVKKITNADNDPVIMPDEEMNDYIKNLLLRKLETIGEDFDKTQWQPYGSAVEDELEF